MVVLVYTAISTAYSQPPSRKSYKMSKKEVVNITAKAALFIWSRLSFAGTKDGRSEQGSETVDDLGGGGHR